MVTVQLNGGLGNQLFQYAAGKALALHHEVPLQIDISWFYKNELHYLEVPRAYELSNFKGVTDQIIRTNTAPQVERRGYLERKFVSKIFPAYKKNVYIEPFCHFDSNFFKSKKEVILKGQWQSEKYFRRYKKFFCDTIVLNDDLIMQVAKTGAELQRQESVAVHIRRADYLRLPIILEWHGVMDKDYYISAFRLLDGILGKYKVYYFTDDPEWVKKELLPVQDGSLMSQQFSSTHHHDFYLMSKCRHAIIANSSFSWWAAWLNSNPHKIVVGPKKWFGNGPKDSYDVLPENWLQI